jgi:hypothetical protein
VAYNTQRKQPDNVIALREPAPVAAEQPEEPKGMGTAGKVAVGVGIAGGVGLVGFGVYKLGARMGWWGQAPNSIVIDDDKGGGGGGGGGGADESSGGDGNGSGGRRGARALGNPPNISGDPQGYNTVLFPSPAPVRLTLKMLGYKVETSSATLVPDNKPNEEVRRFQIEWNKVIRGLDSGKVKLPDDVTEPLLQHLRGVLDEDGIPGKNTLNAMEIASSIMVRHLISLRWSQLVGQTA